MAQATTGKRFGLEGMKGFTPGMAEELAGVLNAGQIPVRHARASRQSPARRTAFDLTSAPVEQVSSASAQQDVTLSPERLLALSRAVESAKWSLAFSSTGGRIILPALGENSQKREALCWAVVESSDRKYAAGLGLGPRLRSVLIGLFVETAGGPKAGFGDLTPARQQALQALTDVDLVRVLARLREDLVSDLSGRLQPLGVEYPKGPYALSGNYSLVLERDLGAIPEVRALMADESFASDEPAHAHVQKLVFEALRLYPATSGWMTRALATLGSNTKSAFVPGGLDALGYSVLLTTIREDDRLWREVGHAIAYARREYINYGSRQDPLFRQEDNVPWDLLAGAYRSKPEADCFKAYASYRSIFTEGKPITKEQFYRNVAVLFLKSQDSSYVPSKLLFQDLASLSFEEGYGLSSKMDADGKLMADVPEEDGQFMEELRAELQRKFFDLGSREGYSALRPFFAVFPAPADPYERKSKDALEDDGFEDDDMQFVEETPESSRMPKYVAKPLTIEALDARLVALGRVLSTAPYSSGFFDIESPLFLKCVSQDSMRYFRHEPEVENTEIGIAFGAKDEGIIKRLCSALQLFKDNRLSLPYTLTERLFGFAHAQSLYGHPMVGVAEFLKALPEEVEAYSPISAVVATVSELVVGDTMTWSPSTMEAVPVTNTLLEKGKNQEGMAMSDAIRGILKLVMADVWKHTGRPHGPEVEAFYKSLDDCKNLQAMFEVVNESEYSLSREEFDEVLKGLGAEPLPPENESFHYGAPEYEMLQKVLSVPLGLDFMTRTVEPPPFAILQAGAHFEQSGKTPDKYWTPYLERFTERVSRASVPVLQAGVRFHQDTKLVTPELLARGWRAAYAQVLGKPPSEPLEKVELPYVAPTYDWSSVKSWASAARGVITLEQQVGRELGGEDSLRGVAPLLSLTAQCYPAHADFFMAAAELAKHYFEWDSDWASTPDEKILDCLRKDMNSIGVKAENPPYSDVGLIVPSVRECEHTPVPMGME